jgi:hypothetical protein
MEERMDGERSFAANHTMSPKNGAGKPDRLSECVPRGGTASHQRKCIEDLLTADWKGCWGKPLTADELLTLMREVFEPWFHDPPVGPIPEYLVPHWSVHACVAEYEDKLEELDHWKALQLSRWLKDRIGRSWCVAGQVYQLQMEKREDAASERFWFRLIEDRTEGGEKAANASLGIVQG